MKACTLCNEPIDTRDGDNLCPTCDTIIAEPADAPDPQQLARRRRTKAQRRARADALRSLGLIRVKGALGGTYWE